LPLTTEQATLIKNSKDFSRNGALLNEDKLKLREIDTELAKIKLTYGENVLAETNNYQLILTTDLKAYRMAKRNGRKFGKIKELEGWVSLLIFELLAFFVTYIDNRYAKKLPLLPEKIISRQRIR
jgi:peptidyl-dipeptidase Dcp